MNAFRQLVGTKQFRIHAALLAFVALLCTQVPLFNYLGFEFSVLMSVLAGYSAGLVTLSHAGKQQPDAKLTKVYRSSAAASALLLFLPLLFISLNALLVRNCSFADGLMFFALGPVPSVLFSSALALLVAALFRHWRRTAFTFAFLGILANILIVTMMSPQIFSFNPLLGYFPGITYDESMHIGGRLALYRVSTIVAIAVIVVLAELVRRRREVRQSFLMLAGGWEKAVLGLGVAVLAGTWWWSDSLSFSSSESSIRRELAGELVTEHFVLAFPPTLDTETAGKLARDHEFFYSEIARQLRIRPRGRIRSFLYESAEQKGRLIGAAGTNIAKPWLRQVHLNISDAGRALRHELVHVMAADFGIPVLGVGMNSGLIEGLATAVERVQYDETLHRVAAQIIAVGIEPDMESLFSLTGFFKGHGGTSYMLAGSFCRYLIDQYGMRRFKWAYRTGDFETFYNRRFEILVAEWRRYISQPAPTMEERTRAAFYFRRPSIFAKECARVIAGLNEETRLLIRRGEWEKAIETSRRSIELNRSPEAITQHVLALTRAGRFKEAAEFGTAALRDSSTAHTLLPLYLTLGDAAWAIGDAAGAKRLYEALFAIHLSTSYDEACALRLEAMGRRDAAELRPWVTGEMADSLRAEWLAERAARGDSSLLTQYLLGRELMSAGRANEALEVLLRVRRLNVGILDYLRMRRIANLYFNLGKYQKAKMYFWESLNFTGKESHRIEVEEWLRRCDWEGLKD